MSHGRAYLLAFGAAVLGAVYYDLGANTAAISELQRVIALDPGDYRPHRLIGLISS